MDRKWYEYRGYDCPWGDYGSILVEGMFHNDKYYRAGSTVPPVIPYLDAFIVTAEFLKRLKGLNYSARMELKLESFRVTHLDWEQWILSGRKEPIYPSGKWGSGPENYILRGPHSARPAEPFDRLFIIGISHIEELKSTTVKLPAPNNSSKRVSSLKFSMNYDFNLLPDFFIPHDARGHRIVSERFLELVDSFKYIIKSHRIYPVKISK